MVVNDMEKAYKELARDIKDLTTKVNDKTKQSKKELKEVLEACKKEYRKLYNENIELKKKVKYQNHKSNKNKCIYNSSMKNQK